MMPTVQNGDKLLDLVSSETLTQSASSCVNELVNELCDGSEKCLFSIRRWQHNSNTQCVWRGSGEGDDGGGVKSTAVVLRQFAASCHHFLSIFPFHSIMSEHSCNALIQQVKESRQHHVVLSNFQDVQIGQTGLVLGQTRLQDDQPAGNQERMRSVSLCQLENNLQDNPKNIQEQSQCFVLIRQFSLHKILMGETNTVMTD